MPAEDSGPGDRLAVRSNNTPGDIKITFRLLPERDGLDLWLQLGLWLWIRGSHLNGWWVCSRAFCDRGPGCQHSADGAGGSEAERQQHSGGTQQGRAGHAAQNRGGQAGLRTWSWCGQSP